MTRRRPDRERTSATPIDDAAASPYADEAPAASGPPPADVADAAEAPAIAPRPKRAPARKRPTTKQAEPALHHATPAYGTPIPLVTDDGRPVSVVHVVAELAPFARTGGLGEAVNSLAQFQCGSGIDTAIVMPLYRTAKQNAPALEPVGDAFDVHLGPTVEPARLWRLAGRTRSRGPRIYFLDHPHFFDRPGLYGEGGYDYPDNARRYAFFSLATLLVLPRIAPGPVLLHAHDWHAALASVYLRAYFGQDPYYRQVATVLSVHNAGFQGHFPTRTMEEVGLPWELYNLYQLEWYDRVNFLKGGLAFSDAVTTVSPTHAHELRTPAGGFGLHDAFISLRDRFVGILNGIDQRVWDPATDREITRHYSRESLEDKKRCKSALQRAFGLSMRPTTPIFAMSARLTYQKGLELIINRPDYFALDAQFIFLGAGEPKYEAALRELAARAPTRIRGEFNFTERMEHRLLAGADMCLMPSMYEPCGLTQMRAQRYGTIPIARRVGGLADTIEDGVTGFLFDEYSSESFMGAATRAIDTYQDADAWRAMVREAMGRDFGWERSEARYRELYRRVLGAHHAQR